MEQRQLAQISHKHQANQLTLIILMGQSGQKELIPVLLPKRLRELLIT